MDFSKEAIGKRIRELREKNGLTLREFSAKVAEATNDLVVPSISALSKWELGMNTIDSVQLAGICVAFNVSADYLIFEHGSDTLQTGFDTGLSGNTIEYLRDDFLAPFAALCIDLLVQECPAILDKILFYIKGQDNPVYTKNIAGEFKKREVQSKLLHEMEILEILRETRREVCGR